MNKYIKKIASLILIVFSVFSSNIAIAQPPQWYIDQVLRGLDLYRQYAKCCGIPKTLIIGAGRGTLHYMDDLYVEHYDEYAYGDKKYDYFLVDAYDGFAPDYVCDATNWNDMRLLGRGEWDRCFLEFLPHDVNIDGALKNAIGLVRPGGKVYMNAENFFRSAYDLCREQFPEKFLIFKDYLACLIGFKYRGARPNFCTELSTRPWLVEDFFRYVYDLGDEVDSVRLVKKSNETWPAKKDKKDLYIWEITKLG